MTNDRDRAVGTPGTLGQEARERFLARPHVGVLGVTGDADRPPSILPTWYAYEPGGHLSVITRAGKRKSRLIRAAGRLSFSVQRAEPPYRYVTVEGTVVRQEPARREHMLPILRRYLPADAVEAHVAWELGGGNLRGAPEYVEVRPDRWLTADFSPLQPRDQAFLTAAALVPTLLRHEAVGRRWEGPSALPRMSIGALACHLGRQVTRAAELLTAPPSDLPVLASVDDHYARAAWTTTTSPDDPANDRSTDDAEAALGHARLLERVDASLAAATRTLTAGAANAVVPIPWQGWALSRDDFLLTRLLEIVVHATDLTASIEGDPVTFPPPVFEPVRDLLVHLAVTRHGQAAVVDALTRRERAGDVTAF